MLIAGNAYPSNVPERFLDATVADAEPPPPPPPPSSPVPPPPAVDGGGSGILFNDVNLRDHWLFDAGVEPPAAEPMTMRRALEIVDDDFETVDAARDGSADGVASREDLEAIVTEAEGLEEPLVVASTYLLDHPEAFELMEVMDDGARVRVDNGRLTESDGRFSREDIAVFLDTQTHLVTIWENRDVIDASRSGETPDGTLSHGDFERVRDATDAEGEFVFGADLREAAAFVLDNDRVFEVLDTAAPLRSSLDTEASAGGNTVRDGNVSTEDLQTALIQTHAFTDDPVAAREFLLGGGAVVEGRNVSDENSVSDAGLRALYGAAVRDTDGTAEVIDLIIHLPETNGGLRNELITASYAELGVRFDAFLGDDSGANWSHWAVPASSEVGRVIRNEQVIEVAFTDNRATGPQRSAMAGGNLLLFDELAPHLDSFLTTFDGDATFDADKLATYLERFDDDQQGLADGLESYYRARFIDDPTAKQEAVLLGNYEIVTHEQALVDDVLDGVLTDLPWYADAFNKGSGNLGSDRANDGIVVAYPGRERISVSHDVPPHDPADGAYENRVRHFDGIEDPDLRAFLEDAAAANDGVPDSRRNTFADDWHEFDERMYYIYQDWRLHHTDQGLLELAADSGYASVDLS